MAFLSISEAAEVFGVSASLLRKAVKEGEIPGHDGPRGKIVDENDVQDFLDRLDEDEDEDEDDDLDDEDEDDDGDDDGDDDED